MLNQAETKAISKMTKDWSRFVSHRNKGKYVTGKEEGFLSVCERENMIVRLLAILSKYRVEKKSEQYVL